MKSFFAVIMVLLVTACTNTTKLPEGVIPQNKMEGVLWDILQAERFSSLFLFKDSANVDVTLEKFNLYESVFQIHKVSKDDFIKSYKYYLSRPDLAKVMFDSMTVKAERKKNESYKAAPIPVK